MVRSLCHLLLPKSKRTLTPTLEAHLGFQTGDGEDMFGSEKCKLKAGFMRCFLSKQCTLHELQCIEKYLLHMFCQLANS